MNILGRRVERNFLIVFLSFFFFFRGGGDVYTGVGGLEVLRIYDRFENFNESFR